MTRRTAIPSLETRRKNGAPSVPWQEIKPRRDQRLHDIDKLMAAGWGDVRQDRIPQEIWDALRDGTLLPTSGAKLHWVRCSCGTHFMQRSNNAKYCSDKCRQVANDKVRRARNQAVYRKAQSREVKRKCVTPEPDPWDLPADAELSLAQRAVLAGCYVDALGSLATKEMVDGM